MWQLLMEVVLLLTAAFALGVLAQQLKQSAIIGYLAAGIVLGPLLFNAKVVGQVAELGVALLLFSIGLEFSYSRLRKLGSMFLVGGALQVILTMVVFGLPMAAAVRPAAAIAVGAMIALSSTAVVLRVLVDRSAVDSVHGRNALGILLLQDVAVVPLVLLVTVLTQSEGKGDLVFNLAKTLGGAVALVFAFYLLFYHIVPRILMARGLFNSRELVVLTAIITALGSIWSAHALGLSPALGGFLAGMLLAESPFASQIRSDITGIRTLFVTLFFTSVGMLANPAWFIQHIHLVVTFLALIVLGKAIIIFGIARMFKQGPVHALATGLTLAQVGEFSFVLAAAAHGGGLINADQFALLISVTILSMVLASYLVVHAESWALFILRRIFPSRRQHFKPAADHDPVAKGHVLIIGFGPAGQQVARALLDQGRVPQVIELNPENAEKATQMNLEVHIGDATSSDILEHAGVKSCCGVVITLPDPKTCVDIIANVKLAMPDIFIIARSRYHRNVSDITEKGATIVVDEENTVGQMLAEELVELLRQPCKLALACALAGERPTPATQR